MAAKRKTENTGNRTWIIIASLFAVAALGTAAALSSRSAKEETPLLETVSETPEKKAADESKPFLSVKPLPLENTIEKIPAETATDPSKETFEEKNPIEEKAAIVPMQRINRRGNAPMEEETVTVPASSQEEKPDVSLPPAPLEEKQSLEKKIEKEPEKSNERKRENAVPFTIKITGVEVNVPIKNNTVKTVKKRQSPEPKTIFIVPSALDVFLSVPPKYVPVAYYYRLSWGGYGWQWDIAVFPLPLQAVKIEQSMFYQFYQPVPYPAYPVILF